MPLQRRDDGFAGGGAGIDELQRERRRGGTTHGREQKEQLQIRQPDSADAQTRRERFRQKSACDGGYGEGQAAGGGEGRDVIGAALPRRDRERQLERRDGVASATIGLGDAPGAAPSSGGSSALVIDAATSRASERARRSRWTGAPCRYRSTWVASGTVGSGGCARRRTVASVVSLASFDRCSAPEHIAERAQRVRAERAQHVR